VFSFGGRHGFVTKNPVEKASVRKTDNRRERFLTLEEISHLGEAFDKVETDGANPKAVAIARLWALTGFWVTQTEDLRPFTPASSMILRLRQRSALRNCLLRH
jgi:hypothetical protein